MCYNLSELEVAQIDLTIIIRRITQTGLVASESSLTVTSHHAEYWLERHRVHNNTAAHQWNIWAVEVACIDFTVATLVTNQDGV